MGIPLNALIVVAAIGLAVVAYQSSIHRAEQRGVTQEQSRVVKRALQNDAKARAARQQVNQSNAHAKLDSRGDYID